MVVRQPGRALLGPDRSMRPPSTHGCHRCHEHHQPVERRGTRQRRLSPMETDEPLETGYGPGTPPGDNFCNDYAQNLAVAYASLAQARGDRV